MPGLGAKCMLTNCWAVCVEGNRQNRQTGNREGKTGEEVCLCPGFKDHLRIEGAHFSFLHWPAIFCCLVGFSEHLFRVCLFAHGCKLFHAAIAGRSIKNQEKVRKNERQGEEAN